MHTYVIKIIVIMTITLYYTIKFLHCMICILYVIYDIYDIYIYMIYIYDINGMYVYIYIYAHRWLPGSWLSPRSGAWSETRKPVKSL